VIDFVPARGRWRAKYVAYGDEALAIARALGDIPGVSYDRKTRSVLLPAEIRLLELAVEKTSCKLTDTLQRQYEFHLERERQIANILAKTDVEINHPKASLLRPYQRIGVAFMLLLGRSMLCDDMGLGKLLPNSEPVLTPTGWVTNGSLRPGDLVIGRNGRPTEVLGVYPQGRQPIVRVSFSDESWVRCSWNHLWAVQTNDRTNNPEHWRVMSTRDIVTSGIVRSDGNCIWRIPMVQPIYYAPVTLTLDPYLLGVLLGNGRLSAEGYVYITADEKIIDRLGLSGRQIGHVGNGIIEFSIVDREVRESVRTLRLSEGHSWEKFVPDVYLRGSPEQRLDLLQGLMDTNGRAMPEGGAEFCSTSSNLIDAVIELVQSLGGIAHGRRIVRTTCHCEEKLRQERRAERISIKLPAPYVPFWLERKATKYVISTKNQPNRLITSIEEDSEEESSCIKVAAEDNLYVTRSYVVTHNTVQSIVAVESTKRHNRVLVVCPNSIKQQWQSEILKWSAEKPKVTVIRWKDREKQLQNYSKGWLIVNYNNFRADERFAVLCHWDWTLFDEGYVLKNRKTKTVAMARKVQARRMSILTGTPIGNNVSEIWSLLHILYPKDYPAYWRFFEMYVSYIEDMWGKKEILGTKNTHLLRRDLSMRMLQRKKEEVAREIPDKIRQQIELVMDKKQQQAYKDMATKGYLELSESEVLTVSNMMSLIVRLRQILSTPANFGLPDDSCKLDAAMDIIRGTDQKVIVFTVYRKTVLTLCKRLSKEGIKHTMIMGGIDIEDRETAKQGINEGDVQVLVCTIRSGGLGLNLQGASIGIFIDKEWNPIDQAQAEDRLHRIGQTKKVQIIDLICKGTIDDYVEAVLSKKLRMTEEILKKSLFEELKKYVSDFTLVDNDFPFA